MNPSSAELHWDPGPQDLGRQGHSCRQMPSMDHGARALETGWAHPSPHSAWPLESWGDRVGGSGYPAEEPHEEGARSFILPKSRLPPHPKSAETCRVGRRAAGGWPQRSGHIGTGGWTHLPSSPAPPPSRALDRLSPGTLQENVAAAETAAKSGARGWSDGGHSPGGGSSGSSSSRAANAQRCSRLMVRA